MDNTYLAHFGLVEEPYSTSPNPRYLYISPTHNLALEKTKWTITKREYWPIMETLTAYVREHASWPPRQALSNPFVQFQGGGCAQSSAAVVRPPAVRELPRGAPQRKQKEPEPATGFVRINKGDFYVDRMVPMMPVTT